MSDTALLPSARHKIFAVSAVGVAMVALPLLQVLQYQQSDLRQLEAERTLLDPMAQAVRGQFGLLAHRNLSTLLLGGQPGLEASRAAVQSGVDTHLTALNTQLTQGLWTHALAETRDLTRDWQALARQVAARSIGVPQSDESHALRQEQMLQVMDLVSLSDLTGDLTGAGPGPNASPSANKPKSTQATALPLLAGARALLALGSDLSKAPSTPQAQAQAQARVVPRLMAFQRAVAQHAPTAAAPEGFSLAMGQALQTARLHLQSPNIQNLQATGGAPDAASLKAAHAAQVAQLALFEQGLSLYRQNLNQRHKAVQNQRMTLLGALGVMATVVGGLALSLALDAKQRLRSPPQALGPDPMRRATDQSAQTPSAPRVATARVMDRLRSQRNPAAASQPGAAPAPLGTTEATAAVAEQRPVDQT